MRKNILITWILFGIIIFLLKNDILFALPDIAHEEITRMSTSIKRNLEESDANGLKNAIGGNDEKAIKIFDDKTSSSNVSQDYPPNSLYGAQHYYDPITGLGLYGIFPNAKTRANDLYKGAIRVYCFSVPLGLVSSTRPWELFAQSLHLVQEMVTPAHTIMADHAFGDSFENYVKDNWKVWHKDTPEEGKIINPKTGQPYTGLKDYVESYKNDHPYNSSDYQLNNVSKYMDDLAKYSRNLPKDGIEIYTDPQGTVTMIEKVPITWEQKRRIAEEQLPKALMYGAGLINTFWTDYNSPPAPGTICIRVPDPVSPAGDHPDDRFDVSDEYYWESEFKLTEADLTDLYMRTATKKGKIGVWYKKQFIETYKELETIYKNSPKEVRDPILVKLYNIGKKLEQRVDQVESDWKGAPDIALFTNGYYNPSISLMLKIGEPVSFQNIDFDPKIVRDHPVMLVPTGGFYGLKNSTTVKALLDEYVKNGGTLVLFAQQHGYDWDLLPVPVNPETGERKPVMGYGYQEDQSCQFNSVYIDTYHPMLSVFSTSTANIGVDGYFSSYPDNSTILLRRVSNGQPAMIMYPYGSGYVIATTLYTDFALTHHQANQTEINLVQNIISWAKKPAELPEIKPGEVINLNVDLTNFVDIDAVSVRLTILDPSRKVINEQTQNLAISPGQTINIPFSYTASSNSALGIYHIDYTLLDAQGKVIQPLAETDSGRFVVSNPPGTAYQPSKTYQLWVTSPTEYVFKGTEVTFTIHIKNNTSGPLVGAKLGIGSHEARGEGGRWWIFHEAIEGINIPAGGQVDIPWTFRIDISQSVFFGLFRSIDNPNTYLVTGGLAWTEKGIRLIKPSLNVTLKTDKTIYARGETLTINATLKNNIAYSWQPTLKIIIKDPKSIKVFEDVKTLVLPPNGNISADTNFTLPSTLITGSYTVSGEAWYGDRFLSSSYTRFDLPQSQITVSPNLPSVYNTGTNAIPFVIRNTGKINVYSGTIDLSLKAPDGSIVYSGSQPFSIAVGETKTLAIPISIPSLKLGNYTLTYSQSDETRTGKPTSITLSNSFTLNPSLDKPAYKIGETVNLTASVTNTGKFIQEGSLTIDIPFLGFSDTKPVTINPSETTNIPFSLALPLTLKQGGPGKVTLTFPSGDRIEKGFHLAIKPVVIKQEILFDKPSYRIRENLGITYIITNDGNFASPLNVSFTLSIPDINYTYEGSLTLEPAQATEVPFVIPIPETTSAGQHNVNVALTLPWGTTLTKETGFVVPESSLILSYLGATTLRGEDTINLTIENTGGVDTTYTTEKLSIKDEQGVEIYQGSATGTILSGEKRSLADIKIPSQTVNGLVFLNIQVKDTNTGKFANLSKPLEINGLTASLQTMTDKNAYLNTESITGISSILNGQFGIEEGSLEVSVRKISRLAIGQITHFLPKKVWWPFRYPHGVAVGPDGSVYVADTDNHRIQKFDSNGNFITKWGSLGSGDGQFYGPYGIGVGHDGSIYVVDMYNNRIQKFDSNGNFIMKWGSLGSGDGKFKYPMGIAVGPDGSVFVADENHRVQKFDSNGNFIMKWGGYCRTDTNGDGVPDQPCDGQFYWPYGIAVGPDGSVYVADSGNNRIQKFDSNGNFIMKWGIAGIGDGQFEYPMGVVVGPDGLVYVADTGNNRIQKFDSNGNFITKWGSYCQTDSNWDGVPDQPCDGQFYYPRGIALGPDGSVYVVDSGNNRIQKFASNGNFITKWGSEGIEDGMFYLPVGVAIGSDSSLFVADSGNHRIQKFDSNGNFITKWGSYCQTDSDWDGVPDQPCDGQFAWPSIITIDSDGSVYVVDTYNHRIQKFDNNGNFITKWGSEGGGDGQFKYPIGVAVGPDSSIYVADMDNHRIQKFDNNGNFVTKWGIDDCGETGCLPAGITVSPDGMVYVSDIQKDRILKFDSNGNFIIDWEFYGGKCGEGGCSPSGIAVGPDGSVYGVNTMYHTVQQFDANGNLIAEWGSFDSEDEGFYYTGGIAVAPDGSIYVANTGNHSIQRMTIEDILETLFETNLPINQAASTTQDYTTNIGTLNATGKLYLQATLKNSIGQTIAQASYPFYIVEGDTVLLFNTDKKVYKLGETVTITGQIENRADIEAVNLVFSLHSKLNTQNSELLFTESFNIPAGGTRPFTITTTAGSEGIVTLTGKVTQNNSSLVEITDQYEVALPNVSVVVSVPDVIGSEPFNINVEIRNTGKVNATVQFGVQSLEFGDSQTITIPPGEIKILQYSQQVIQETTYTFTFAGDIEQTIQKQVRFGESAEVLLTLQSLYKEGDTVIPYQLKNTGELEAAYPVTFTLLKDGQEISKITKTFTLPLGGSVSDSLGYNLIEGLYVLRYETRGYQGESQVQVVKAAQGEITMGVNDYYPEGTIILPYTVKNIGPFDAEFGLQFELGTSLISETVFIPAGGEHSGDLRYDLVSGDYTIRATLVSQPSNPFSKTFRVLKENQAEMTIALSTQTGGLIPVNVNLTNLGFNEISGSVNVSVSPSTGQAVWNGVEPLSQLSPQSSQLINFNINPSAILPGNYLLKAELLNNSNQLIVVRSLEFGVQSANFQITQLPPYQTFMAGQEATFVFRVRNIGDQEGSFDLRFKAYDLIDSTQREWLKPGEEKAVTFGFMLPEDLEEKDYFASYELKDSRIQGVEGSRGQIKYRLAGINLNVNASLDKPYYNIGDTAHLTINIQTPNPNPQNLFARVNYAGYELQQTFTLSGSQVLIFDVPLPKITGEKLFYGIYHGGGRSIHLNSLYVHKTGDVLTIETDKQVYNPGENVSVSLSGNVSGNMTLSGPGGYTETFPFTGTVTKSFALPLVMTAGTYFINATLEASNPGTITASHPFDVAGIQVKVLECQNDKGKYASSDTITTNFTISSNTTMPAILKAWIVDPNGQYASVGEDNINLSSSENSLITHQSSLATSVSGIHRLVYGIYAPGSGDPGLSNGDLLLVSGSEAFDVGDAVLLGLSTDKRDYPTNMEPVIVTASLLGSMNADLRLELDGNVIKSETISLNGSVTYTTQLQDINPGPHILKGILTAGGLTSTKETSFTYALAYMPKPQISASPAYLDFGNINLGSTSTKTVTLSSTGNVDLVIGTITLSGTNQGEFSIQSDNCSGRTITPPGTCRLDIFFSPISIGTKSASLSIPSNAIDTPTLFLPLSGTGITTLNLAINPGGSGKVTGTGIDCPGDCTESYAVSGATVQLTATPMEGYQFTNWTGDVNLTENPVTINMDTNKNITANFVISTFAINAQAGSGGTISPSGSVIVNYGESQTFTITPNPGFHIVDVKVDGAPVGAVTTYTFNNLTANHTIEVSFAISQYTITATAGSNGTITPTGSVTINYGADQSFIITPDTGYHILDVKVDGVSVGPVTSYIFNNVTSNHTIEVTFEINNNPPVADAGRDQNVITGQVVTLNGSKSYDPEGVMITFLWTFVEVPAGSSVTNASLSDVTSAKPEFIPDVNGAYRLQLIVNDGALTSVPDEVVINATTPNVPPNANAGPDQNVVTGSTAQLDGSRSSDPDNGPQPLSYLWSFLLKPAGSLLTDNDIIGRNQANASFIPDVDGFYQLKLTVSDGELSSEDTVQIIATLPNVPPNANAGADMTINMGDRAVFDSSASNDPDHGPQPLTYLWSFVAVPTGSQLANGNIMGADTVSPSFNPDVLGTYVLELMVFDGMDAGFDNVAVTVINSPPNPAPAGGGVCEINSQFPLNGQISDYNGDIVEYEWSEGGTLLFEGIIQAIYGGAPVNLPEHSYPCLVLGEHTIHLSAYDGINQEREASINISVRDTTAPTLAPVPDKNILWPPNHKMVTVTIRTNARDNSGGPVTLSAVVSSNEPQNGCGDGDTSPDWTEPVINQTTGVITLQLRSERSGMGDGRVYTIRITATDSSGNSSVGDVQIIVPHDQRKK